MDRAVAPPRDVYGPDILHKMGRALDLAWRTLPPALASNTETLRRRLARRIILHVDRGEHDARRLAYLATVDILRWPTGNAAWK